MRFAPALFFALVACGGGAPPRPVAEAAQSSAGIAVAPPLVWNELAQPATFSYVYWTVPPGFRRERLDVVHVSCTTEIPLARPRTAGEGKPVTRCEPGPSLRAATGATFDRFFACNDVRQMQPSAALLRSTERALVAGREPQSGRPDLVVVLSTLTRRHEWVVAVPQPSLVDHPPPPPRDPSCSIRPCPPQPIEDYVGPPRTPLPDHEEVREERTGPGLPAMAGRVLLPSGTIVLSELLPVHAQGNAYRYDERVALNRAADAAFFRDLDARLRAFDPRTAEPFERAAYHANLALLAVERGDAAAALAELPAIEEERRAIAARKIPWSARYEQTMSHVGAVARALEPLARPNVVLRDPCAAPADQEQAK